MASRLCALSTDPIDTQLVEPPCLFRSGRRSQQENFSFMALLNLFFRRSAEGEAEHLGLQIENHLELLIEILREPRRHRRIAQLELLAVRAGDLQHSLPLGLADFWGPGWNEKVDREWARGQVPDLLDRCSQNRWRQ